MKNFDLNFQPKEYFQENGHQIYDLWWSNQMMFTSNESKGGEEFNIDSWHQKFV